LKTFFLMILSLCLVSSLSFAQEEAPPERLDPLQTITEIPSTSWKTLKVSFSKESILPWSIIIGSTALLYHYDADLFEDAQKKGRDWGIGNSENTKTVLEYEDIPLLRLPSDLGSTLYFLGDGWTHFSIAGGFFFTGLAKGQEYNRAYNTGLQIVHGMFVSTMFNQAIKRTTGRESPSERTEARGRWRPFPSVKAYQDHTSMYDAFPSGHVMTATLTFTVINENYPEYSYITVPLATTWVTLLGWQMMNNAVHWASDYPLAIAMGYVIGKQAVGMGKKLKPANSKDDKPSTETAQWHFFPSQFDGVPTLNLIKEF